MRRKERIKGGFLRWLIGRRMKRKERNEERKKRNIGESNKDIKVEK